MKNFFILIIFYIFFTTLSFASEEIDDQINTINTQLNSIEKLYEDGVLDQVGYEKSKKRLLNKKAEAERKKAKAGKKKKPKQKTEKGSEALKKTVGSN